MSDRPVMDMQDPLPEANWLWRRVFIFAVTASVLFFVYNSVDRLGAVAVIRPEIGIPAFVSIVKLLVFTINVMALFYMVAPSAEQITKLVKTAGLLRAGVQMASRTLETPDRKEVVSTVGTGVAAEAAAPPADISAQNGGRGDDTGGPGHQVPETPGTPLETPPTDIPPITVPDKEN